eukprot:CAMPEP_0185801174 /NCGR_PEP_ID=MMETSP1322-20130828/1292_1 /TAXON_ID=265543 /ORGANISM="Minutocellus polymorphus, Strain RCC2270" /LENGTH=522 /DNA_ID=CAMNT_0028496859 /DNA_START=107 /DNA_END=1675 /DNA_ORIENTATION=-
MSETSTASDPAQAAQWDLTAQISPHLDLHMMFPLLEYVDSLITAGLVPYTHGDVAASRLALLRPTHMVDYAMDIYRELHGADAAIPQEMEAQKAAVYKQQEELRDGCIKFDELCKNEAEKTKLIAAGQWNVQSVSESKGISAEAIETYRKLAKFNYDCGDYQTARDMLENYLSLHASPPKPEADDDEDDVDDRRSSSNKEDNKSADENTTVGDKSMYYLTNVDPDLLQILWGRLSCEILVENWEAATVALTACKNAIERLAATNKLTPLEALKQRTWLMHWSLFVKWNTGGSKGLESMVELFFTERYLQAITTVAPHLLRYLTAAVLLVKRRVAKQSDSARGYNNTGLDSRRLLKDLIRTMQHCDYTDPIVEFVDCLCVKFDFDGAQEKLAECRHLLETDFFLCKQTALFMEEARVFVFENYCRIHNKVDLSTLGQKLAMDEQAAERWIVDLIRNASLDAKIDTEERCVVMGTDVRSTYERVIDKTRDLNVRSGTLVQNMENVLKDSRKEKVRRARAALEEE